VAVDLGVQYPARAITLNPPAQGGTIQTQTEPDSLEIENAEVENGETRDYWDGSDRTFTSGIVEFEPSYNLYHQAPDTKVENGIVYNHFTEDSEFIPLSGQQLVSGRDISLVATDGDLSQSQVGETAIDVNPVSAGATRVPVTNGSDTSKVTIKIPTKLSEKTWVTKLLHNQIDNADSGTTDCGSISNPEDDSDSNRFIENCDYNSGPGEFNTLVLIMEPGETYNLNLAKVSVGDNAGDLDPHYITTDGGSEGSLVDIELRELTFEVRDRFDNPVSGAEVPLEATNGEFESGSDTKTVTTNENGEITVTFVPDDVPDGGSETAVIRAGGSLDLDGTTGPDFDPSGTTAPRDEASFKFTVVDSEADTDVGGSVNPSGPIVLTDATTSGEQGGNANSAKCKDDKKNCIVHLQFSHNNNGGEDWKITELRYHFYLAPGAPGSPARDAPPMNVRIMDNSPPSCNAETYTFQDNYEPAPLGTIPAGGNKMLILNFSDTSSNFKTIQGDGFFITMQFESTADPSNTFIATYFASPVKDTSIENPCN
jgi:hypothetical protein